MLFRGITSAFASLTLAKYLISPQQKKVRRCQSRESIWARAILTKDEKADNFRQILYVNLPLHQRKIVIYPFYM